LANSSSGTVFLTTELQPPASLIRKSIPLQVAIGLIKDGHLNESIRQGRSEITLPKRLSVMQLKETLQRLTGHFTLYDQEQLIDFGGD
jgi:hypothetical protein